MASGLTPDQLVHYDESKKPIIVSSLVMFLILGNGSVLLRVLSQLRISRRVFAEDYFIILAVVRVTLVCFRCAIETYSSRSSAPTVLL